MKKLPGKLVLLGHPVSHSLSPVFQQAALDAAGINLRYEAVDVSPEALPQTIGSLTGEAAAGNVTIPHKETVYAACVSVSEIAERVGAVNTFWTENGELHGDNTDVGGFDFAVERLMGQMPSDVTVALLGAGGAAAAVCAAVERWSNCSVRVYSRTGGRASALASRFPICTAVSGELEAAEGAALVVNATPLGLDGSMMPIAPGSIAEGTFVLDLTYRRGRTPWVRACRSRGLRADDGTPMLIEQGALSFERWFGVPPDREAMWQSIRSG